ncbi:hypothetical protein [Streptomyces katrae]|uniref:hypothetical protein n=1 Tax=Streptomyces katrae TaxID=68223 RepID=UPI0009A5272E|nr:hypothetical protein [Streptomyces katrae]
MLDEESALRLAAACTHESEIRQRLRGSALAAATPLDAVLTQDRDERELAGLLDALHRALRATGDRHGLDAYTRAGLTNERGLFTVGVDHAVPVEPMLLCPLHRCLRHESPDAPAGAPRCAVNGAPLLRRED